MKNFSLREINYIETLYLYCNIDKLPTMLSEPIEAYYLKKIQLFKDNNYKFLGDGNGREWYQFKNYKIGIMDYQKSLNSNNYNLVIQFSYDFLISNYKIIDLCILGGTLKDYIISRVDVTKIFKNSIDYTTYLISSNYRTKTNYRGTIYLGKRENGNVFRLYNKTKELKDTKNYKKIEKLSEIFGDTDNLYTAELELRRKYLQTININTLEDISKLTALYNNIVGKIKFLKDTDKNKHYLLKNNTPRIKKNTYNLTEYVPFRREKKEKHAPSYRYLIDNIVRQIRSYNDKMDIEDDNTLEIVNEIIEGLDGYNGYDLEIIESKEQIEASFILEEGTTQKYKHTFS